MRSSVSGHEEIPACKRSRLCAKAVSRPEIPGIRYIISLPSRQRLLSRQLLRTLLDVQVSRYRHSIMAFGYLSGQLIQGLTMADAVRNTQVDTEERPRCSMQSTVGSRASSNRSSANTDHAEPLSDAGGRADEGAGTIRAIISPEYGGLGLSATTYAKIIMSISSSGCR